MGWYIYIAEIGALLLIAYSIGWAIGYAARGLVMRKPVEATVPAARLERIMGEPRAAQVAATALAVETVVPVTDAVASQTPAAAEPMVIAAPTVAVPRVAPLESGMEAASAEVAQPPVNLVTPPVAPLPAAPQAAPVQVFLEPAPAPAPAPGRAPEPAIANPEPLPAPAATAEEPKAQPVSSLGSDDDSDEFVILGRAGATAATIPVEAAPALAPGMAWAGEINGHAAPLHTGTAVGPESGPPTPAPAAREPIASSPPVLPEPLAMGEPEPALPLAEPTTQQPEPPPEPAVDPSLVATVPDIVVAGREPARAVVDHDAMFAAMFAKPQAETPAEPAADEAEFETAADWGGVAGGP